jgi:hypothetical protein
VAATDAGGSVNLRALDTANRLRREAIISDDCPILHAAADSEVRRLVNRHNDAALLARAKARTLRRANIDQSIRDTADALRSGGFDDEASAVLSLRF